MRYSRFEWLAMGVGICAVAATILTSISGKDTISELIGQGLIIVALFGGLHYGRKGALAGFIISAGIYAIVTFAMHSGEVGTAAELFIFRTIIYAIVAFVSGELNVRLKYLFIKLEHHDYVDDITSLYNSKYLAKLVEKYISEFDRYGSKFSMTSFTVNDRLLTSLKKKARNKLIKDIGNSVIRGNIRGADEAARLEGTTFTVLFPSTNLEGANAATTRVKDKVINYLDRHGLDTEAEDTVVTKIIEYPRDRDAVEELAVNLADTGAQTKI